jgi:hypothetical protein
MEEITGDGVIRSAIADVRNAANGAATPSPSLPAAMLAPGDRPPYDIEAT